MKRVVECPSCHTKLQIFDIGKKIEQKCPRCANTFVIEPEGKEKQAPTAESVDKEAEKKNSTQTAPAKDAADKKDAAPVAGSADKEDAKKKTTQEAPAKESVKEKSKTEEAKKEITVKPPIKKKGEAVSATEKKTDNKSAAKVREDKKSEADKAAKSKTSSSLKKPSSAPAPTPTLESEPPLAGLSGLQFMILAALLAVIVVLQVINHNRSSDLIANQKLIYEQVKGIN